MTREKRIALALFAVAVIAAAPSSRAAWVSNGIAICTMPNTQDTPTIASDGAGGAIVAWQDFRSNNVLDIYAQRLNSSGYIQWTSQGVPVCTGKASLTLGQVIPDGAGGAVITWSDRRNATNDIFAQRIDASGTVQWTANGVSVCTDAGSQVYPCLAPDGSGGAIIAWQDNRNGANDIYAQRIDAGGAARWTADGVGVCNAGQYQSSAQIIPDGHGGAVIAWTDHRNTVDNDVFAQRVDSLGAAQWTTNGVVVSQTTNNQMNCRLVPGGTGEAIVAWIDYRTGGVADIYAQKLNASGVAQWTANGVPVCVAANRQVNLQLVQSVSGGAVAVWEDERTGTDAWDVYAQRIGADGSTAWTTNGVAVCQDAANQTTPQLAPDGVGGALVAWKDDRSGNADIYAQRVDAAGHTVVGTRLRDFVAAATGAGVLVEWTLSEAAPDIEFSVLRARDRSDDFLRIAADVIRDDHGRLPAAAGAAFSFTDDTCEPGEIVRYRVDALDAGARTTLFETDPIEIPAPSTALYQNRPNPFNPSTVIRYFVNAECTVSLEVYDATGRLVRRLEHGRVGAGSHAVEWNGLDERGRRSSAGVYFYRLKAGKDVLSRTMILVR